MTIYIAITLAAVAAALMPFRNGQGIPISLATVWPLQCMGAIVLPWITYGAWSLF